MSAPLGPFETSSEAMLALRPEDGSFTGREALFDLLSDILQAACVEMATWDWRVADWLAGLDVQTVAAVAGWVQRARRDDMRRLAEIRALLAKFDWEHHDRQLALEAIERIVTEGEPMEVDTGQFAALRDQVGQLAARVEQLHRQALIIRTLEETALVHAGYGPDAASAALGYAFDAGRASVLEGAAPRPAGRRPRHLRAMDGGAS